MLCDVIVPQVDTVRKVAILKYWIIMGRIIDYCCTVYPSLVFPMFMKCIDGSGLVKLVDIRLALLTRSVHLCGEDENWLKNIYFPWVQWKR